MAKAYRAVRQETSRSHATDETNNHFTLSCRVDKLTLLGLVRVTDLKLLILGGYGVFGGRLGTLIKDNPFEVLIAGRSIDSAQAFCAGIEGTTQFHPLALDRRDIAQALLTHQPDIVIDASGPFQDYGHDPYAVIRACIDAKVHYLDFADAADFVFGIDQFNDSARAAGVFVLSGVSSFPVLTAAVLREINKDMPIEHVTGGIAPSPFAGIGLNVMRAVVGYAGRPVKLWRGGRQQSAPGLAETRHYTIAPPGKVPLHHLRFSLVDVPDLQVIPPEHPEMQSIWMGAGPVPVALHRILNLLAKLRAKGLLPTLTPAAPLFYRVLNLLKFGEHRGGMFVQAHGHVNNRPRCISWHLLAEGDDGPLIPSMAIAAILQKCLSGNGPAPGARAATEALNLSDYDTLFAQRSITTGFRDDQDAAKPLYQCILGTAFEDLPDQVQAIHAAHHARLWQGEAEVTAGRTGLGRGIARLFGFPTRTGHVPVRVQFDPDPSGELWTRSFDGQILRSFQSAGTGRDAHLLIERFGPFSFGLALVRIGDRLHLIPRKWRLWGLPMPALLLPAGDTYETQADGRFRFHVDIQAPLLGRLVRYQGWLDPVNQGARTENTA